jgi:hypothetical protein
MSDPLITAPFTILWPETADGDNPIQAPLDLVVTGYVHGPEPDAGIMQHWAELDKAVLAGTNMEVPLDQAEEIDACDALIAAALDNRQEYPE